MPLICSCCGRDINLINQDNMSHNSSPLCEDCYYAINIKKCVKVKMTYEEFCWLKNNGYSLGALKHIACKYLKCKPEEIDDIDFNFKLTFDVYLVNNDEEND